MRYADLKAVLARIQDVVEFSNVELIDANQLGMFGNSPLKVAIVWADTEAVRILIESGADVNVALEDKMTPLHWAAAFADGEVAQLLLDKGARWDVKDRFGDTPLDTAKSGHNDSVERALLKVIGRAGPKS